MVTTIKHIPHIDISLQFGPEVGFHRIFLRFCWLYAFLFIGKKSDWSIDVLSYSIASGIPMTLTIVKCWNNNHQSHKHTYSHEVHDQNDRSNRSNTLYDSDDWHYSIWHSLMSQEFHWQLSNWVGPIWAKNLIEYYWKTYLTLSFLSVWPLFLNHILF